MKRNNILLLLILCCSFYLNGQTQKGTILIKNGTLLTISDGIKEQTDLLIQDGKIKQIGKNITVKNVEVFDATGMYIMPGIVDAHSHIAISNVNDWSKPVTADVWVGDVLNPLDISLYHALAGGVTISHVMHGSANAIGGQCETIKHRYGTKDPEVLRMEDAPRTIKFALGENPIRMHGHNKNVSPSTRMGVEQIFRDYFSRGKAYRAAWNDYNANKTSTPPLYNYTLETMADILDGDILIHCHSYRADEILMLMDVCKDFGVKKLCFQHVNEGFKVAPELAEFGATASVFSDWWAYKFEVYYSTAYNATILTKNGVMTSINSDSKELNRHLYHEAAKSQRYGGLSDNEALQLITINPATQLGIEDRVGSLEVGKEGDIAIFDQHPLSIYAICQATFVDGVKYFDRKKDPKDMRLQINLDETLPTYIDTQIKEEACMQGLETEFHNHKNHKHE